MDLQCGTDSVELDPVETSYEQLVSLSGGSADDDLEVTCVPVTVEVLPERDGVAVVGDPSCEPIEGSIGID